MNNSYVKTYRSPEFNELAKDHAAFVLAAIIAVRARRTNGMNLHALKPGEALLGDYKEYGMSETQYREAKKRLERAGYATFHGTNKGTIAKLENTQVFDPNIEPSNSTTANNTTGKQRTPQQSSNEPRNGQTTSHAPTNKYNGKRNNGKRNEYTDDFGRWWAAYGMGSKSKAFQEWEEIRDRPATDELIKKTEEYLQYCEGIERKKCDGHRWLSERMWETKWEGGSYNPYW